MFETNSIMKYICTEFYIYIFQIITLVKFNGIKINIHKYTQSCDQDFLKKSKMHLIFTILNNQNFLFINSQLIPKKSVKQK